MPHGNRWKGKALGAWIKASEAIGERSRPGSDSGASAAGKPMTRLAEIKPFVPVSMLDGAAWDRLVECADALPSEALASRCGFEFRLGSETPDSDLFVTMVPGEAMALHVAAEGRRAAPGPKRALAEFAGMYSDADSGLQESITGVMLEYDLVAAMPTPAGSPGLFFQLPLAEIGRKPDGRSSLPTETLCRAVGWRSCAAERQAVRSVLDRLPDRCVIRHIGAFPGRNPRTVRLLIQGFGREELENILAKAKWNGPVDAAIAVVDALVDVLPWFRLAADVTAQGLQPRLGMEFYLRPRTDSSHDHWLATGRGDWRPVASRLAECGWCVPAKARGLGDWCALDRFYDRSGMNLVYKGINHIKVSLDGGRPSAKAYAGMIWGPVAHPAE